MSASDVTPPMRVAAKGCDGGFSSRGVVGVTTVASRPFSVASLRSVSANPGFAVETRCRQPSKAFSVVSSE
jgi:hypothetical protein